MKLIKVGRSQACDIVLNSENVSALHAEIIVIDNNETVIIDKNSANGTFVSGKRITPNVETKVRRGTLVQFADTELNWSRVPKLEKLDDYKTVVNIGSNYRNDIQLTSEFCSRFHAILKVDKKNNASIKDLNSKNGVKVNGIKIRPNTDYPVKYGDNVICADEDITEAIKPYLPNHKWIKQTLLATACLLSICLLGYAAWKLIGTGNDPFHSPSCTQLSKPSDMTSGVVLVQTQFYYVIEIENNPIPNWSGTIELNEADMLQWITGTGFFIDDLGNIATNRHVACPWDYPKDNVKQKIRLAYEEWLDEALGGFTKITNQSQYNRFRNTELGSKIDASTNSASQLNAMITQIRHATYKVTGRAYTYCIAYPGRNYTKYSEMDICDFIGDSGDVEKDVAILQRNTKTTPEGAKIFDITKIRRDKLVPLEDKLYTIGYPLGLLLGLDNKSHELQPRIHTCSCSKTPSRYEIEIQGTAIGGQSGSPVYDDWGHLVGIVSKSFNESNIIWAVQAKYLEELYKKCY